MLSHPDPQIQYIFTTLETQRDALMIENGNLSARNKELEAKVAALEPPKEDAPPDEATVN